MNVRLSPLSRMHRVLDRPLSVPARALVLAAVVALLVGGTLPLWRIRLVAPQYAEGLSLDMYAYQIVAGNGGQDLAEINTLNHYIGMKPIVQAESASSATGSESRNAAAASSSPQAWNSTDQCCQRFLSRR